MDIWHIVLCVSVNVVWISIGLYAKRVIYLHIYTYIMDKRKCQNSPCRTQHTSRCLYGNVMNALGREKHWKAEGVRSNRASYNCICISEGQIYEFYYQPGPAVDFDRTLQNPSTFPWSLSTGLRRKRRRQKTKEGNSFSNVLHDFFFSPLLNTVKRCFQLSTGWNRGSCFYASFIQIEMFLLK